MIQVRHVIDTIFKDKKGVIIIFQWPNIPLIAGLASALFMHIFTQGRIATFFSLSSFGFLFVWCWPEIISGVTWFRRIFGLFVFVLLMKNRIG